MTDEEKLLAKLRKIEALHAGQAEQANVMRQELPLPPALSRQLFLMAMMMCKKCAL